MVAIQYIPPVAIEAHEQRVRGKSFQPHYSLMEGEGKCTGKPFWSKKETWSTLLTLLPS